MDSVLPVQFVCTQSHDKGGENNNSQGISIASSKLQGLGYHDSALCIISRRRAKPHKGCEEDCRSNFSVPLTNLLEF